MELLLKLFALLVVFEEEEVEVGPEPAADEEDDDDDVSPYPPPPPLRAPVPDTNECWPFLCGGDAWLIKTPNTQLVDGGN